MAFLIFGFGARPAAADNELAATASTFYIVAPGSDNSIAPIVHALTDRLQQLFDRAGGSGTVWVIPRLAWEPADLENQCENDPGKDDPKAPKVLGGIILEGTNTYSSTDPYVIWAHGWAKVTTNAEVVSCKPTGFVRPTITWVSNDVNGYGSRNGIAFETAASAALIFAIKDINTKYLLTGVALGGEQSASNIPPVNDALTTRDAAARVVNDLVEKLSAGCAQANPNIAPMCGRLGLVQAPAAPPAAVTPQATASPPHK
jgi:hypothetical protein